MSGRVIVLGAGMVGVSCALSLGQRGFDVTMFDRDAPGRATSFGNSGVLSRSSIFPINGPALLGALPNYLGNRHPAVRWRPTFVLSHPIWLARFLAECSAASVERRSRALDALISLSMDINRNRIADAGLAKHLRETGWLKLWRTSTGPAIARAEADALERYGIDTTLLHPVGIGRLEPDAAPVFTAGLHVTGSASVDDPGAVVAGLAQLFVARGGRIVRADVSRLQRGYPGWIVDTSAGIHKSDRVVVALGPWSAEVLRPLGLRIPLGFERGYHLHLATGAGMGPRRPVYDVDAGYVASPMRAGVRVTSGVELAARDAAPDTRQIELAARCATEAFRLGARLEQTPWLGSRPTLPDSMPMIGAFDGLPDLYAAFGHQHIGFSTGAGTGELIAAAIAGEPPPISTSIFAPARHAAV